MSDQGEEVGDRLDRLNFVLNQFMADFEGNQTHASRISVISSVHQSFCENSIINTEEGEDAEAVYIPPEVLEKFQECLTEIDRVNMELEDYRANHIQRSNKFTEIDLSISQIKELNQYLSGLIQSNSQHALFKLNQDSLVNLEFRLVCSNVQEKMNELELENLRLRTENFESFSESSSVSRPKSIDSKDLFFKHLELQKKMLLLSQKEQELEKIQEEFGFKMAKAEVLLAEYQNKIEDLSRQKLRENNRKHPSQDYTRTRTPVPLGSNLSTSSFISDLITTRQEIQTKLMKMEKLIKQKYKKSKTQPLNAENYKSIIEEYRYRDTSFQQKLGQVTNFQQKEKFILNYLKESRDYLYSKIEYLQRYEGFLVDNWTKANGEPSGFDAAKKASAILFHKIYEFKKEREILDERLLRINRIKETVKKETVKLQEHRKKILVERQNLQKQQSKIETYLKGLAKLNNHY